MKNDAEEEKKKTQTYHVLILYRARFWFRGDVEMVILWNKRKKNNNNNNNTLELTKNGKSILFERAIAIGSGRNLSAMPFKN